MDCDRGKCFRYKRAEGNFLAWLFDCGNRQERSSSGPSTWLPIYRQVKRPCSREVRTDLAESIAGRTEAANFYEDHADPEAFARHMYVIDQLTIISEELAIKYGALIPCDEDAAYEDVVDKDAVGESAVYEGAVNDERTVDGSRGNRHEQIESASHKMAPPNDVQSSTQDEVEAVLFISDLKAFVDGLDEASMNVWSGHMGICQFYAYATCIFEHVSSMLNAVESLENTWMTPQKTLFRWKHKSKNPVLKALKPIKQVVIRSATGCGSTKKLREKDQPILSLLAQIKEFVGKNVQVAPILLSIGSAYQEYTDTKAETCLFKTVFFIFLLTRVSHCKRSPPELDNPRNRALKRAAEQIGLGALSRLTMLEASIPIYSVFPGYKFVQDAGEYLRKLIKQFQTLTTTCITDNTVHDLQVCHVIASILERLNSLSIILAGLVAVPAFVHGYARRSLQTKTRIKALDLLLDHYRGLFFFLHDIGSLADAERSFARICGLNPIEQRVLQGRSKSVEERAPLFMRLLRANFNGIPSDYKEQLTQAPSHPGICESLGVYSEIHRKLPSWPANGSTEFVDNIVKSLFFADESNEYPSLFEDVARRLEERHLKCNLYLTDPLLYVDTNIPTAKYIRARLQPGQLDAAVGTSTGAILMYFCPTQAESPLAMISWQHEELPKDDLLR